MRNHPCREDDLKTGERRAATAPEAEAQRLLLCKENLYDELKDPIASHVHMSGPPRMPYPGCKCLLWGATAIANDACNEALKLNFGGLVGLSHRSNLRG